MSIQIKDLFYTYSPKTQFKVEALKDISLSIDSGSYVAFIGQTGSGKSTLIQNLNGLLIPTSGEVEVDDFKVTNNKRKNKNIKQLRKHLGIVFQFPEYQLFEETVLKDVMFGLKNFGIKEEEAKLQAKEALLSVGIDESFFERSPFDLSGGEKRRVAMAGILALKPDILVVDEPTAGLDPLISKEILKLLDELHHQGKTIILVTHDMDIVLSYAEKVFLLHQGKLIFSGKPIELFMQNHPDIDLEMPKIYQVCKLLIEKGFSIDVNKVKSIEDLAKEIKRNLLYYE